MPSTIHVRLALWRALSKKKRTRLALRHSLHRKFMDDLMGRKGVPLGQSLLESACNRQDLGRSLLDRAARMGALPNEHCNNRGGLAMHHYARHGESALDAWELLRRGFDPMAPDGDGMAFIHHAFEFHNKAMAAWIVALRPDAWSLRSNEGDSPMDLACGEPSGAGRYEPATRGVFRDWAFGAMPEAERQAFLSTAWLRCAHLLSRRSYGDPELDLVWLAKLGASAPAMDGPALLALVARCEPDVADRARPFFEQAIALTEQAALREVAGLPASPPRRSPRSI